VVKLHPTKRPLVPVPATGTSSSLLWISGSPRNGSSSTLTKRNEPLRRCLTSPTWRHCVAFPLVEPCGTRKAPVCCNGSKRSGPELRLAQMRASCIDQPCVHSLLCRLPWFSLLWVQNTLTHTPNAIAPSPTQPTYVRIDDAYADGYRSRHRKEVNCSLMKPVIKTLQGHPEAGVMLEKHTNKIIDELNIVYTTYERSICRGTSEVSAEVRSTGRSSFFAVKSTTLLSLALRLD
jgi:hypothetical protein